MYKKYPKTKHCLWSQSSSSDDLWMTEDDMKYFEGKKVVGTTKLDGQNTNWYNDFSHARSIDSMHANDPSRSYSKMLHAKIKTSIPSGYRICGEDLYARHSIYYDQLPAYFFVFGIIDSEGYFLSWLETEEWCIMLGLETVPVIYYGRYDEKQIKELHPRQAQFCSYPEVEEGYVVRIEDRFHEDEFNQNVFKFVKKGHVGQNSQHWFKNWKPNQLILAGK